MYGIIGANNRNREALEEYRKTAIGSFFSVTSAGRVNYSTELSDRRDGWVDYMLLVVEKGEVAFTYFDKSFKAKKGDILIMKPTDSYTYTYLEGASAVFMHFTSGGFIEQFEINDYLYHSSDTLALISAIESLVIELNSPSNYIFEQTSAYGMQVIGELAKIANPIDNENDANYALTLLKAGRLGTSTVNDYAKKAGLSKQEFSKLIKAETGLYPKEYIITSRIEVARKIIKTSPDASLKKIAETVGYSDYRYFVRVFKKHNGGVTPSEYRKQILGK